MNVRSLRMIRTPALEKTDQKVAFLDQSVDSFVSSVHRLDDQIGKDLIVKQLEAVARLDFDDRMRRRSVQIVQKGAGNVDRMLGQTLEINFIVDVTKFDAFANKIATKTIHRLTVGLLKWVMTCVSMFGYNRSQRKSIGHLVRFIKAIDGDLFVQHLVRGHFLVFFKVDD